MADMVSAKITVHGKVQGVSFRYYTSRQARGLGLTGYVRNLPGGKTVEVAAEGERGKVEGLISWLGKGPPMAKVEQVETVWSEYSGEYHSFSGWH